MRTAFIYIIATLLLLAACSNDYLNQRTAVCGNGEVEEGEECDRGNLNSDSGDCTLLCLNARCGDGLIGPGELCDDAGLNSDAIANRCRTTCVPATCGDGVTDEDEDCDDGNNDPNDGCSNECTVQTCGNGVVEGSEDCDDGNQVTESCDYGELDCVVCDEKCREAPGLTAFCGNSIVEPSFGETCDDGNTITESCAYGEAFCEVCDATCQLVDGDASFCGDGVLQASEGEECDDGNDLVEDCPYGQASCSVCGLDCEEVAGVVTYCGDGFVQSDEGEQCDSGSSNGTGLCGETCQWALSATPNATSTGLNAYCYVRMAIDSIGQPHINYAGWEPLASKYAFKEYGAWQSQSLFGDAIANPVGDIAVGADDSVHIVSTEMNMADNSLRYWRNDIGSGNSYLLDRNPSAPALAVTSGEEAYVAFNGRFEGLGEYLDVAIIHDSEIVYLESQTHQVNSGPYSISLVADSNDILNVVYITPAGDLFYRQIIDDFGDSEMIASALPQVSEVDMVIDQSGRKHVAYTTRQSVSYATLENEEWVTETIVEDSYNFVDSVDLAMSPDGTVHLVYVGSCDTPYSGLHYAVRSVDGSWSQSLIAERNCAAPVWGLCAVIEGDDFGNIHLAYTNNTELHYGVWRPSSCGNGVIEPALGETCDEGAANGTGTCSADCQIVELGDCNGMATIPAGSFWMGCDETAFGFCDADETPYYEVYVSEFEIDKCEVSVADYEACVNAGDCTEPVLPDDDESPFHENTDSLICNWEPTVRTERALDPINCVTWYQAAQYCESIGKRLPTEAEWEKAARGTDGRRYPWGNEPEASCDLAVLSMATDQDGCGENGTLPVGSKPQGASPYGVYNMLGNVFEWTGDWYAEDYFDNTSAVDPVGPASGNLRVNKGYNYDSYNQLRISHRFGSWPDRVKEGGLGFRCADTIGFCGDGVIDSELGETCDDGNDNNTDGCTNVCSDQYEIEAIDLGGKHTCVLVAGGQVKCWGFNLQGTLGYGNSEHIGDNELPSAVGFVDVGEPVKQMVASAGGSFNCVLLESGAVRCWGYNPYGELGYGHTDNIGDDEEPFSAGDIELGGAATQITAGGHHACALLTTGEVKCWGQGAQGQLGYGNTNTIGDNETPASVGAVNVGGTVKQIAAGSSFTCAVLTDGSVKCWGLGHHGKLGYGNEDNIGDDEQPASVGNINVGGPVASIHPSNDFTCALMETGSVRCWGRGNCLGYGSTNDIGDDETPASAGDVNIGGVVVGLSAKHAHVCALLEPGSVRCWGYAGGPQLGYGLSTPPIGDDEVPASMGDVNLGGIAVDVKVGDSHSCALLESGAIRCWGENIYGQCGYGYTTPLGVPTSGGDVPVFE